MSIHESHEPIPSSSSTRPFSIDLSLELERQLDNDSQPPTPAHNVTDTPIISRESLDPHVLASIVLQLRQSLTEITKERDDLISLVPSLRDSLESMTNKCTMMEEELHEARSKAKDDEEAITLLRSKVEESRRGLMRLQTENRRASAVPAPIDLSRAGKPTFSGNKRQSFTPMTGKMNLGSPHRRTSSVSDGMPVDIMIHAASPSPHAQLFSCETPNQFAPSSSRRLSGFFGRTSPSHVDTGESYDPVMHELDGLRRELRSVKNELEETRHELSEAREMRDASETCVKALREFIAEHNIGVDTTSPTVISSPTPSIARKSAGWGGFTSLFNKDIAKPPAAAPSLSSSPPRISEEQQSPIIPTKKFGSFFSSRASMSSTASQPLQLPLGRDISGSDVSSVEESEPVSPTNETVGGNVVVSSGRASPSLSSVAEHVFTMAKAPGSDIPERMETISLA